MVWAEILWYSILLDQLLPFMAELLQGSTWTDRVSVIQTLFPTSDAVFQDDNASILTAGTVQSWFEVHAGEHHSPWPA
jgi:hypothetical protein